MFNRKKYQQLLSTGWLGQNLAYHEEVGSTNTFLKKIPAKQISHGQLCLTDFQTEGRGQYKRLWESSKGENLTFTLVLVPKTAERLHSLTLACAHALVLQIMESCYCNASIKWPNDVYINHKKVAGILTETVFNGSSLDRMLIGIGINVNQEQFSEDVRTKASSLKLVTGSNIDRELFLCELLSRIEQEYEQWENRSDHQLKAINQKLIGYGQWVNLSVDEDILENQYKLLGINEEGKLTGINKEGDIKSFSYEQVRVITN